MSMTVTEATNYARICLDHLTTSRVHAVAEIDRAMADLASMMRASTSWDSALGKSFTALERARSHLGGHCQEGSLEERLAGCSEDA